MKVNIPAPSPTVIAQMIESDGPGGAEILLSRLSTTLRDRGHEIVPFIPTGGIGWLGDRLRSADFSPESFSLDRAIDLKCLLNLVKSLKRRDVKLIHSHEFTLAVYGAACAEILRIPHVTTLHGTTYPWVSTRNKIALRWAATRPSTRATVTISQEYRRRLSENVGISEKRLTVVPNGVPPGNGNRSKGRHILNIPEGYISILSVGRLEPIKGYDILLDALGRIKTTSPHLKWKASIAGQGSEEHRLRSLSREIGISDHVRFLGMRDDIPDLLAATDIFVMPSLSEGLPLSLLEAMFSGTTIIASNCGGIPEAIRHGIDGLLFETGQVNSLSSTLLSAFSDRSLRYRLAHFAQKRAETTYTIDSMTDRYIQLYNSVYI